MHILPASYLAEFCDVHGRIWANKYTNELKKTIRYSSPDGICYAIGFYKMPSFDNLDLISKMNMAPIADYNELFLEKSVNKIYEDQFVRMLPWFRSRQTSIAVNDKFNFCRTILHFMARNTRVRNSIFFNDELMRDTEGIKRELIKEFESEDFEKIEKLGLELEDYLELAVSIYVENLRHADNSVLHNNFIIQQHIMDTEQKTSFLWRLVQGSWDVLEVTHPNYFIVTDHPGNFSSPKGQSRADLLSNPYELFFPLNSGQLLRIQGPNLQDKDVDIQLVKYVKIDDSYLQSINHFLAESCVSEIYCASKEIISVLRERRYPSK